MCVNVYMWIKAWSKSVHCVKRSKDCVFNCYTHEDLFYHGFVNYILKHQHFGCILKWRDRNLSGFIKYLYLCFEDERKSYGSETTWVSKWQNFRSKLNYPFKIHFNVLILFKNMNTFHLEHVLHLKACFTSGKMGHLCRRNVKLFLNLELSRLRKARKCIFGLCWW